MIIGTFFIRLKNQFIVFKVISQGLAHSSVSVCVSVWSVASIKAMELFSLKKDFELRHNKRQLYTAMLDLDIKTYKAEF